MAAAEMLDFPQHSEQVIPYQAIKWPGLESQRRTITVEEVCSAGAVATLLVAPGGVCRVTRRGHCRKDAAKAGSRKASAPVQIFELRMPSGELKWVHGSLLSFSDASACSSSSSSASLQQQQQPPARSFFRPPSPSPPLQQPQQSQQELPVVCESSPFVQALDFPPLCKRVRRIGSGNYSSCSSSSSSSGSSSASSPLVMISDTMDPPRTMSPTQFSLSPTISDLAAVASAAPMRATATAIDATARIGAILVRASSGTGSCHSPLLILHVHNLFPRCHLQTVHALSACDSLASSLQCLQELICAKYDEASRDILLQSLRLGAVFQSMVCAWHRALAEPGESAQQQNVALCAAELAAILGAAQSMLNPDFSGRLVQFLASWPGLLSSGDISEIEALDNAFPQIC